MPGRRASVRSGVLRGGSRRDGLGLLRRRSGRWGCRCRRSRGRQGWLAAGLGWRLGRLGRWRGSGLSGCCRWRGWLWRSGRGCGLRGHRARRHRAPRHGGGWCCRNHGGRDWFRWLRGGIRSADPLNRQERQADDAHGRQAGEQGPEPDRCLACRRTSAHQLPRLGAPIGVARCPSVPSCTRSGAPGLIGMLGMRG